MRVVCDTNILARSYPDALGPSRRLLDALRDGPHHIVISEPMLDELERTLGYPHLQQRWRTNPQKIALYRRRLEAIAELTEPAQGPPIVPGDPDDDVIVYTAVAGAAEVICSRDLHFPAAGGLAVLPTAWDSHPQRPGVAARAGPWIATLAFPSRWGDDESHVGAAKTIPSS